MTKLEVQNRVLQNGKPISLDKFDWNEKTKTFFSPENNLVIDFSGEDGCTFATGSGCTFKTGFGCTFKTWSDCTFRTEFDCTFKTWSYCTFKTGSCCTFKTGGVTINEPPAYFTGSRYPIGFSKKGFIKSGCITKPVGWWLENIERCAEEHGYTPDQIAEYRGYVDYIAGWMKRLGLDVERKRGGK
jgi:hypothetical protein